MGVEGKGDDFSTRRDASRRLRIFAGYGKCIGDRLLAAAVAIEASPEAASGGIGRVPFVHEPSPHPLFSPRVAQHPHLFSHISKTVVQEP